MVHRARLVTEQRKVNAGCSEGTAGLNKGMAIPPRSSEQTILFASRLRCMHACVRGLRSCFCLTPRSGGECSVCCSRRALAMMSPSAAVRACAIVSAFWRNACVFIQRVTTRLRGAPPRLAAVAPLAPTPLREGRTLDPHRERGGNRPCLPLRPHPVVASSAVRVALRMRSKLSTRARGFGHSSS